MQYKDSYLTLKLESCFLESTLICVCGMPSRPVGILTNDGGYYSKCSTCSVVLSIDYVPSLFDTPVEIGDFSLPGMVVDFKQSDLFMDLWCVCGAKTQFCGRGHEELQCHVCRLTYYPHRRLGIRALPRDYSFDFGCNSESPYPTRQQSRRYQLEEECIEVENVPDVENQVAAFFANPLIFWSKTWLKDGDQ